MNIIELPEVDSTNSWVSCHWDEFPKPSMIYAISQNQGRGQRGNSWESESGKNLTASVAFIPEGVEPRSQFVISEAVALAVTDLLKDNGIDALVKWPNDIYVSDKKICGILIENSILGKGITRTIAGIGLNINQKEFLSDAPNPISMTMITGREYDIKEMASSLAGKIEKRLENLNYSSLLSEEYRRKLWRGNGKYYRFYDKKAECPLQARIHTIEDNGTLVLEIENGDKRSYAFKEVEFTL